MKGGPGGWEHVSGKSRLFVLEQEVVTTHFPAVAYHVHECCDNRLEIRRNDRRQGARCIVPSLRAGEREKNYEKAYLDSPCRRYRHCHGGRLYHPLLVDGRQQQRPGPAPPAAGLGR